MRTWILLSTFALALPLAACGDDTGGSGGSGSGGGDATSTTDAATGATTATTGGGTAPTVVAGACPSTPSFEISNTGATAFNPTAASITAGGTIQFTSAGTHTMTADDNSWETPQSGGQSCITFPAAGDFPFHCFFHTNMVGTITVTPDEGRSAQAPSNL